MQLPLQVQPFFETRAALWCNEGLFCALSGGADSIALALVMHELQLPFTALHCNFHLRGDESDADEHFVREFCAAHDIPLKVRHFDVEAQCQKTGESIEMAARTLRYDWFAAQGGYVCVAHHSDDQAETLLLQLIRGTGLRGLAAMAEERDRIWRPFLEISRSELLAYLRLRHQAFVEDSTNTDTHYRRNWVRHQLLPLLCEVNPSVSKTLTKTAARMRQALSVYELGLQHIGQQVENTPSTLHPLWGQYFRKFSLHALQQLGEAGQLWWRECCLQFGFSTDEAQQALQAQEGFLMTSPTHHICRHGAFLTLAQKNFELPQLSVQAETISAEFSPSRDAFCATVDATCVEGELTCRTVEVGDRFTPFGMHHGSKLVSDYLTDRHRSRIEKQRALVVCDAQGIIWLVGETIAQRVATTNQSHTVLRLTFSKD